MKRMSKERWEERDQEETRLPYTVVLSDRVTIPYGILREANAAMQSSDSTEQPKEGNDFPELPSKRRTDPVVEDFVQSLAP